MNSAATIPSDSNDAGNSGSAEPSSGIGSLGFQGLLWTNWLTAINDNIFRWFVIGVGKTFVTPDQYGQILLFGTGCFVLPYILFASPAGWLADRFSKRQVIVACKIAEIVIMTLGVLSLLCQSLVLLMGTVFLMGAQSALFAPSKVGTIPELLSEKQISAGNGIFNLATLSAVVIGMGVGGWLADHAGDRGQTDIWLTALVLVGVAAAGTGLSFLIRRLPAADPAAKFPITLVGENIRDIGQLVSMGRLFRVALGVIFFWAIASFAQLNIDVFAEESGSIFETERTPLLVTLVLGLGVGSLLAGLASGDHIELGLVPWGVFGIALFSFLLWFTPADFIDGQWLGWKQLVACGLLAGLGMSAGFLDVPLASYLQHNSPPNKLGSILSATNCLMFTGILLMSFLLGALTFPTYEGSLAKLPSDYQAQPLPDADRQTLDATKDRLTAAWSDVKSIEDAPDVEQFLTSVSAENSDTQSTTNLRVAAINELVVADARERISRGEAVSLKTYDELFPKDDDQRHVKKVLQQAGKLPLFTARQNFLIMAIMTLPVLIYAVWRLSQQMVRIAFVTLLKTLYRTKVRGTENIPTDSGAILVANHSSWLDGAIILTLVPGIPRTIAWAGNFAGRFTSLWARFCGLILISGGPKSIRAGLQEARDALGNGELLGVFPEGGISRTGQVRTFRPGLQKILDANKPAAVVPMYFDEIWGSIFSHSGGRAFTKFPNSIRRPLSVHIGQPLNDASSMFAIQQAVARLGAESVEYRAGKFQSPAARAISGCKKRKFKSKFADSMRQEETGGSTLARALVLRRLLNRGVLAAEEKNVGVLIPPTVGGTIVNLALALDKRVSVNLNYSLSEELINFCIDKAGLKHVLTTRKVMDKFGFKLNCDIVYLDDFKDKVTTADKAISALQAYAVPAPVLKSMLGLNSIQPDDVMTIVFTSGSTGVPKGVMLTQQNISTNVDGIDRVASLNSSDTLIGILPFFHSMGYTVTLWTPAICDIRAVYHFSPLDAKIVGKLSQEFDGTILVATPTFLRSYLRRCTPEQFHKMNVVVAGAERLPPELCDEFEQKFGVRPVEGYGATELSPITAVNIPPSRQPEKKFQIDNKVGTVGRPIVNVAAKIVDLDSGKELGPGQPGMLWITGPNVMKGYLDLPDATAEVLQDGWYKTGDMALVDEDGFIQITGRISRFSKIGGEMVPHVKIEEVLTRFLDETPDDQTDDLPLVAVTAVADEKKGERLIVLYATDLKSVDEMRTSLTEAGLPNLFIPSADGFYRVEALPLLGTGKIDLKGIKVMAEEIASS